MRNILVCLLLAGCDASADEPQIGKPVDCETAACERIAACTPSITEGIDFRSAETCLADGWTCVEPDACLAAVYALPCLSDPPNEDEAIAAARAFVAVKRACLGITH